MGLSLILFVLSDQRIKADKQIFVKSLENVSPSFQCLLGKKTKTTTTATITDRKKTTSTQSWCDSLPYVVGTIQYDLVFTESTKRKLYNYVFHYLSVF